jgi:hypothetical protein
MKGVHRVQSPSVRVALILTAIAVSVVAAVTAAIIVVTDGGFSYTFDDAYIHLRLSEMIAAGTYGINPGEPGSPSSSAIWPFMLAPFSALAIHPFVPLLLATASLVATLVGSAWTLALTWRETGTAARILLTLALGVTLNWFGLPFTGLEHSLQTAMAVGCAGGLVSLARSGTAPWWFWAAIIIGPLVRFENLGISAVAVGAAALLHHRRQAVASLGLVLLSLLSFSAFLVVLGLEPLPSSVIVKSGGGPVAVLTDFDVSSRLTPELLWALAACIATLVGALVRARREPALRPWLIVLAAGPLALTAHLLVGPTQFQLGRYHVAVLSFSALICLAAVPVIWPGFSRGLAPVASALVMLLAVLLTSSRLPIAGLATLAAARGIHDQQGQLHNLVIDHLEASVALNDLGWMSYRNPRSVIDLAGLGSADARRARSEIGPAWIESVVDPALVPTAIIYSDWFGPSVPNSWTLVGTVVTPDIVTNWSPHVDVYATDISSVGRTRAALMSFASTLGERTTVVLSPEGGGRIPSVESP